MLLYRYRRASKHSLDALENNCINGSLFRVFKDGTELNLSISKTFMEKRGFPESRKESLIKSLIENIGDNYYLACFTKTSPLKSPEMWSKFADNGNGYCLVYDTNDILAALINKRLSVNCLRPVVYSKKPFCLDDMIDCFLFNEDVLNEAKSGNIDGAAEKVPEIIKKQTMEIFFHKVNKCKDEKEYRLIFQRVNGTPKANPEYDPSLLIVKPQAIIISKKLNILVQGRLISYAQKQGIECQTIEIPQE